jgi:hypothetical protein
MKTEKQLTTVEWFVIELRKLIKESELSDMRPSEFDTKEMVLIEQAKEMERQEQKSLLEWIRDNAVEVREGWHCIGQYPDKTYTDEEIIEVYQKQKTFKSE